MVDVTLSVIAENRADLPTDPNKAAYQPRRGDILDIYRSSDVATLVSGDWHVPDIGTTKFVYIHVRDVPNQAALRMRNVLCSDTGERSERIKIDPDTGLDETVTYGDPWRFRRFRIPRSVIPAQIRVKLLNDREVTVQWPAFRNAIRKKIASIRADNTVDDESISVTDSDLA